MWRKRGRPVAADLEIEAMAAQADSAGKRTIVEQLRRALQHRTIIAYRRLFLDAEGKVRPEAVDVIADIASIAQLGRAVPTIATEGEMRAIEGRRMLALHILGRMDLDGSRLRDLSRKMREHA